MRRRVKISEDSLIELVGSGSQEGFRILYENYSSAVYGIVLKIVIDERIAEDVLQDAFVKIWRNFSSYSSEKGRLFTWVIRVARNMALDSLRSKSSMIAKRTLSVENFVSFEPGSFSMTHLDYIGIDSALSRLNPEEKTLIQLAYFQGYTRSEIAKETSTPLGTVKTKIRAALQTLRQDLVREENHISLSF